MRWEWKQLITGVFFEGFKAFSLHRGRWLASILQYASICHNQKKTTMLTAKKNSKVTVTVATSSCQWQWRLWVWSAQSHMPSSEIWQVGSEGPLGSPWHISIYCNICLSLSSVGKPLPFGAQPSRSPARSSPAFVVPVRDGRFLGLGHCII